MISNTRIVFIIALLVVPIPKLYTVQNNLSCLANDSTHPRYSMSNWAVSADFVAWLASEEISSIWADVINVADDAININVPGFNFKWDYGFRIGLGRNLAHDQWDTAFYWTRFHTDAKHSISSILQLVPAQEFFAGFLSGDNPRSMSAKWSLFFNMFDWELGRNYLISNRWSMRPFLGIKAGWINQSIHARYDDLIIDEAFTNSSGKEYLKNNFFGIGPSEGINVTWKAYNRGPHCFNVFGDFSTAALWGSWMCSDVYNNTIFYTSSVNTKKTSLGALAFRGFMGIEWDASFNADRSHFAAKIGYEMQLWLNQLRINTFQLQRLQDDLTLQGITFYWRFDF